VSRQSSGPMVRYCLPAGVCAYRGDGYLHGVYECAVEASAPEAGHGRSGIPHNGALQRGRCRPPRPCGACMQGRRVGDEVSHSVLKLLYECGGVKEFTY